MKRRLYVELDGLLDTRLATLILLDEAEAAKALDLGYRTRLSDDWVKLGLAVDQATYDERYRLRDRKTLQAARPTGIVPMVHQLVGALGKMADNTPFVEAVTLDINFWPYQVSEAERQEILTAVSFSVGDCTDRFSLLLSWGVVAQTHRAVLGWGDRVRLQPLAGGE